MHSEEQILRLIQERVDHPATVRELLQFLKIRREERAGVQAHACAGWSPADSWSRSAASGSACRIG